MWSQRLEITFLCPAISLPEGQNPPERRTNLPPPVDSTGSSETTSAMTLFGVFILLTCLGGFVPQCSETSGRHQIFTRKLLFVGWWVLVCYSLTNSDQQMKRNSLLYQYTHFDSVPFIYHLLIPNTLDVAYI